jgi:hypothetical protein
MKQKLKKGNHVVMHTCEEANFPENYGKVWTCISDQFIEGVNEFNLVFLEGYPNSFQVEYLQLVNLSPVTTDIKMSFEEWKEKNYGENYEPDYDDNGVCDGTCDGCLRSDYVDYLNYSEGEIENEI